MKRNHAMKRRTFLGATGRAAGLVGILEGIGSAGAWGAADATGPGARSREAFDRLAADLDARSRKLASMPGKDCRFLHLMVKATQAKNVLELGTGYGVAAIWMGLALEETGGKLTTVEILADRAQAARTNVGEAGLAPRITLKTGDAHQVVPTLEGAFDFVLLNADKDGQMDYFRNLYPKRLPPGGLLLAYGAIQREEKMKDYLDALARHPDFDTVVLSASMDDGFAVSRRRPA
jgi:caffeoyl-CoA O-methyltransferase